MPPATPDFNSFKNRIYVYCVGAGLAAGDPYRQPPTSNFMLAIWVDFGYITIFYIMDSRRFRKELLFAATTRKCETRQLLKNERGIVSGMIVANYRCVAV